MTNPARPLSYEASKFVIQYLPADQRLNIRLRCPSLHTADSLTPLRINTLRVDYRSLTIDDMEYFMTNNNMNDFRHYDDIDQIRVTNHKRNITAAVNLEVWHSLTLTQSFLMNALLGGRQTPIIVENFELKSVEYNNDIKEEILHLPKDLKLKVKSVGLICIEERVLDQLSSRITGGPLTSFRVLNVNDLGDPLLKHALIQNSQKIEIPINNVLDRFRVRFDLLSVFGEKEIILNNDADGQPITDNTLIINTIMRGQENNSESGTNLAINTTRQCMNYALSCLVHGRQTYHAVVDDMEYNRCNIPCACFPINEYKELNVYSIPDNDTILKLKVMPQGSARHFR